MQLLDIEHPLKREDRVKGKAQLNALWDVKGLVPCYDTQRFIANEKADKKTNVGWTKKAEEEKGERKK